MQFAELFDSAFMFDIKKKEYVKLKHSHMQLKRAKHCSCLFVDPTKGLKANRRVLVAGGITETTVIDVFAKTKIQTFHDTDLVEYFDFRTKKWDTFNARLAKARHGAAVCELKGFLYVVGGHTVDLPNDFINSIERCSTKALQSSFDLITIRFEQMDVRMQTALVFPVPDDNGLLILGHQHTPVDVNQALFFDCKDAICKISNFNEYVGPINHWHNSYSVYKSFTCFLTD